MLGVVIVAFCIWSLLRPANDAPGDNGPTDTPVSSSASTSTSESTSAANPDSGTETDSGQSAPELEMYTTDLDNNIGKVGYDEQQMVGGKTRLEMYRDVLKGYNSSRTPPRVERRSRLRRDIRYMSRRITLTGSSISYPALTRFQLSTACRIHA